jgi:protein-L-isoaspartate(D-aspartate) O-methyltransferase
MFYANLVTSSAGVPEGPIRKVFAATPREQFVGPGPWRILTSGGYVLTPSDDPAFLYQDVLVGLTSEGTINNGQPSLHALCLSALKIKPGNVIVHVGAGTGYYTAMLSQLTGPEGSVIAYELEPELARAAEKNLESYTNTTVYARSGSEPPLPACDVLYVNAGATAPLDVWLEALRSHARLLFPLTPDAGFGGMLLVTRNSSDHFRARFLTRAMFIPCVGARDEKTARKLTDAFKQSSFHSVRSLRRGSTPDRTCWVAGDGWWLSTGES